jgi:hypothetical protein
LQAEPVSVGFLLELVFDSEDGDDTFLRKSGCLRTTHSITSQKIEKIELSIAIVSRISNPAGLVKLGYNLYLLFWDLFNIRVY